LKAIFGGEDFEDLTEFIWKRLPNDHHFGEWVSMPGNRASVSFSQATAVLVTLSWAFRVMAPAGMGRCR